MPLPPLSALAGGDKPLPYIPFLIYRQSQSSLLDICPTITNSDLDTICERSGSMMNGIVGLCTLLLFLSQVACRPKVRIAPVSETARPGQPDLEQLLPGVALVLAQLADGKMRYGAGLLIEGDRIVTSLHVVKQSLQ